MPWQAQAGALPVPTTALRDSCRSVLGRTGAPLPPRQELRVNPMSLFGKAQLLHSSPGAGVLAKMIDGDRTEVRAHHDGAVTSNAEVAQWPTGMTSSSRIR